MLRLLLLPRISQLAHQSASASPPPAESQRVQHTVVKNSFRTRPDPRPAPPSPITSASAYRSRQFRTCAGCLGMSPPPGKPFTWYNCRDVPLAPATLIPFMPDFTWKIFHVIPDMGRMSPPQTFSWYNCQDVPLAPATLIPFMPDFTWKIFNVIPDMSPDEPAFRQTFCWYNCPRRPPNRGAK